MAGWAASVARSAASCSSPVSASKADGWIDQVGEAVAGRRRRNRRPLRRGCRASGGSSRRGPAACRYTVTPGRGRACRACPVLRRRRKRRRPGCSRRSPGSSRSMVRALASERGQVRLLPFDHQRQPAGCCAVKGRAGSSRHAPQFVPGDVGREPRPGRSPVPRHRRRKRRGSGHCRPSRPLLWPAGTLRAPHGSWSRRNRRR